MSEKEKLQRAIEATIAAGYQLNSEAFEFLSQNSVSSRSGQHYGLGLQKLARFARKTIFYRQTIPGNFSEKSKEPEMENADSATNAVEHAQGPKQAVKSGQLRTLFIPYAKHIKAELKFWTMQPAS